MDRIGRNWGLTHYNHVHSSDVETVIVNATYAIGDLERIIRPPELWVLETHRGHGNVLSPRPALGAEFLSPYPSRHVQILVVKVACAPLIGSRSCPKLIPVQNNSLGTSYGATSEDFVPVHLSITNIQSIILRARIIKRDALLDSFMTALWCIEMKNPTPRTVLDDCCLSRLRTRRVCRPVTSDSSQVRIMDPSIHRCWEQK